MDDYKFVDHTQVRDRLSQTCRLSVAAFAEHDPAPSFDDAYTEWFLRRPGSSAARCVAALDGEQMVSMALVAIQPVQIGSELVECGIIDTVATHPQHRRRGLARRLMCMAHEIIQEEGADAAILYTNPQDHSHLFYQQLGYETRSNCRLLNGKRPEVGGTLSVRRANESEHGAITEMLNDFYASYEGYAPLDEELWAWRKTERALGSEVDILVAEADGEIAATCTSHVTPLLQAQPSAVATISDFASREDLCDGLDALNSLLAAASQADLACAWDAIDPICDLFQMAGFVKEADEVSMVLPLSDKAQEAVKSRRGPWYPMVESICGV